ncbi:exo-alpha-sialidase [Shewanella cyperi]|uniref:Exo-alpha-sialidase n=1 Tax=Shewanella cyperi TaxID=2814292 RepID=A0A975AL77_9GAMM|nr:exo-alpha-sialidase [Shewanella cyperi]QSX30481.1 exo-alpha-sialidase [Shewanella cyperi]
MVTLTSIRATALLALATALMPAQAHQHQEAPAQPQSQCPAGDIRCAETVTAAFGPDGRLWRAWVSEQQLYLDSSTDVGANFGAPLKVNAEPEAISTRGENRPKLGFDGQGGLYLSWAMAREQKYSADIRLSYSADGGAHFTTPRTINDDGLVAGHAFNEMLVSPDGDISLVWLDSRAKALVPNAAAGSAVYFARGNLRRGDSQFLNSELVRGTCQCCRLAFAREPDGTQALLWRHLYPDNVREFALLRLKEGATAQQVSFDDWQLDGCPHQGGALGISDSGRYHMTWFNAGRKGQGIFYAYSDDGGVQLSAPLKVGNNQQLASHPHLAVQGQRVDLVWTEYNGSEQQLWWQGSTDGGALFGPARQLAASQLGSDRPFVLTHDGKAYVSWHRPGLGHFFRALP